MKDCSLPEVKGRVCLFTGRDREGGGGGERNQCIVSHIDIKDLGSENELQCKKTTNVLHCLSSIQIDQWLRKLTN